MAPAVPAPTAAPFWVFLQLAHPSVAASKTMARNQTKNFFIFFPPFSNLSQFFDGSSHLIGRPLARVSRVIDNQNVFPLNHGGVVNQIPADTPDPFGHLLGGGLEVHDFGQLLQGFGIGDRAIGRGYQFRRTAHIP
jgi:hypothetical protein